MVRDALDRVVLEALNGFHDDQTVWIVLDRMDKCLIPREALDRHETERHGRRHLLTSLVKVTRESTSRIKVLAIVNRTDWRVEEDNYERDGDVLAIQRLDQSLTS